MVKYRIVIDKNRCIDCGISVGRCPAHARSLARVLERKCRQKPDKRPCMGVFSEDLYDYVKKVIEACPQKALTIERIR